MGGTNARKFTRGFAAVTQACGWLLLLIAAAAVSFFVLQPSATAGPLDVLAIAGIPGATGAVLAFWRWGLILDESGQAVTQWRGLGYPMFRKTHPRRAISAVGLAKEVSVSSKGTRIEFVVRLRRQGAAGDIYRRRFDSWQRARCEAEAVAKFLHADLHDESSGETVVREAAHLDESLVRRHRRLGIPAPLPSPPAGRAALVRHAGAGNGFTIEIPSAGYRATLLAPVLAIPAVVVCAALVVAVVQWHSGEDIPWPVVTALLVLISGPPTLMLLVNMVSVATWRETLTVSSQGVEVTSGSLAGRNTRAITAAEIEEVIAPDDVPGLTGANDATNQVAGILHPATLVLIRTDRGDIGVGRSLPLGQRGWLRDMLVHGLVADSLSGGAFPAGELAAASSAPTPVRPAYALQPAWRWILVSVAVGAFAVTLHAFLGSKNPARGTAYSAGSLSPDYARYELKPGPGSGYLRLYGRGVQATALDRDLRISIEEILLLATRQRSKTAFRDLALSLHRQVDGQWRLVGHAETKSDEIDIPAGGAFSHPGPHAFVIRGAAETCLREPCYFRLHVVGRVGSDRPGWDVTEMVPVDIRP